MSGPYYPVPPPSYGAAEASGPTKKPMMPDYEAEEPLFGQPSTSTTSAGEQGIYSQPEGGDLPDDFKYGVSVSQCHTSIRNAFIRKVYSILLCQILATAVIGGFISRSATAIAWVHQHVWSIYVPLLGTLVVLFLLWWKRHSYPLNFVLLSAFTLMEAFTLGVVVAFVDTRIVLQALLITTGIFVGLTLFTLQSKVQVFIHTANLRLNLTSQWDFSGMGPFLFAGLIGLVITGLVGMFVPWGRTVDIAYAGIASLIFSGYIIFDTYMITKRLSPDEYIMATISLYLDFINLFINILRLLSDIQDR